MANSVSAKESVTLEPGERVRDRWTIVRMLAEGDFHSVYQAIEDRRQQECAIKIEPFDDQDERSDVLKMEVHVLRQLRGRSQHACTVIGAGIQDGRKFKYLVTTLVGRDLSDLHRSRPDRKFSSSTTARLAIQCVQGLQELHNVGFVHRDVKPGKLAIGRNPADRRNVYILGFCTARCYMLNLTTKEVRRARPLCEMRGSVRYASVNAQLGSEQGRHDDLLRLMYVLVEFRSSRLPWNDLDVALDVMFMKVKVPPAQLFKDLDDEYGEIYSRLAKMTYHETPDYDWIIGKLRGLQGRQKYPADGPFEWENDQ